MIVELSAEQWALAGEAAEERQANVKASGAKNRLKGRKTTFKEEQQGAAGELAASLALGLPWTGRHGGRRAVADVGRAVEVRSTHYRNGHLIVHPEDKDGGHFCLVIALGDRRFDVVGTLPTRDAKVASYEHLDEWDKLGYWVPQSSLAGIPEGGFDEGLPEPEPDADEDYEVAPPPWLERPTAAVGSHVPDQEDDGDRLQAEQRFVLGVEPRGSAVSERPADSAVGHRDDRARVDDRGGTRRGDRGASLAGPPNARPADAGAADPVDAGGQGSGGRDGAVEAGPASDRHDAASPAELVIAGWAEAHRQADTPEKRAWLARLALERGEATEELCGFLRSTYA